MAEPHSGLYSLVLILAPRREALVGATLGHQAHAAFLQSVRAVDPPLSAALHEANQGPRPFTVSPLLGIEPAQHGQVRLVPEAEYVLRITVLDQPLYERFMAGFLHGDGRPSIRLGPAELLVKEIRATPQSHPWAGYTTWAQLMAEAGAEPEMTLEFSSPTAFGFGQKAWGKMVVVLPQPELVYGSLVRSWNGLAPQGLGLDREALAAYLQEGVIKRIDDLRTQMLHFQKSPQVGYVGRVTYGLLGDDEPARRTLALLGAFAFYGGVGMKTAMGMGQCRRIGDGH